MYIYIYIYSRQPFSLPRNTTGTKPDICRAKRIYVCMHVCVYVCVYVGMRMSVCMHACMCVYMYACVCMYACMHVYMYVCMYVCMHACMDVGRYSFSMYRSWHRWWRLTGSRSPCRATPLGPSRRSAELRGHICMYVCMYICMYACMYVRVCV